MKVSIIIVNHNSGPLTQACVESLLQQKIPSPYEIIVIDNGSQDNSVSFLRSDFPEVRVVDLKENLGLAAGLNHGLALASGTYCLALNPDIIALPGSIAHLIEFMDKNPRVGVSGGQLLSPNGKIQSSCYRFYQLMTIVYRRTWLGKTPWGRKAIAHFLMKDFDHQSIRDVDWLMGSCLCVRQSALKEVGGMDERFFLYFEDVDWCRRFWQANWRVTYVPTARFSHFHQQSSRQGALLGLLTNWTTREHIRSAFKYFWKYRGRSQPRIA